MKNILILCTGNSCRSQMAHGFMRFFGGQNVAVYSAGIETSDHTSNHVDEYAAIAFDHIITVCDHAQENCPYIPSENAQRWHKNFSDPSKLISEDENEISAAFAATRDEIKAYCKNFVKTYLLG